MRGKGEFAREKFVSVEKGLMQSGKLSASCNSSSGLIGPFHSPTALMIQLISVVTLSSSVNFTGTS